ncbi:hypothetical protein FXV83_17880 [Bradyrhizobium hipponense]|uniref:Uncharacterized protein n=1 Tax=Bradyrhizobium hipponense TaxID=2605638 RepID=A0A5S4YLG5_9BRAD|nr:hypothetical protein FXV83_17880 [Bradyrhizobium hipponense]
MPGLVPGIHVLRAAWQDVDGRVKPGHDAVETSAFKLPGHIRSPPCGEGWGGVARPKVRV